MADPAVKKGSGLKKKLGPLPLYAWVGIAVLVIGYFMFFRKSASGGSNETSAGIPVSASPDQQAGLVPSAGSPSDNGGSTSDLLSALGSSNDSLLGALLQTQQNVVALAQTQQAALAGQTAVPAIDNSNGSVVSQAPGGSNAPVVNYVFPSVTGTVGSAATNTATKAGATASTAKKAATPVKYQTYKRDVILKAGQTVHFASGHGYYAA